MENVLRTVVVDSMLSEESVSPAINHAKPVRTPQSNVLPVLTTTSVPTEDVSNHALQELISTAFQGHADHAHLPAPHAAHNKFVSPAPITRSSQSVANAYHASTHALHAALTFQFAIHA